MARLPEHAVAKTGSPALAGSDGHDGMMGGMNGAGV